MRHVRYIPGNKRSTYPTRAIWVDTETLATPKDSKFTRHDLWFGWALYSRRYDETRWTAPEWFRFEKAAQFWDWSTEHVHRKTALYQFAHNAGYDFTVLDCWEQMREREWKLTGAVIDSPPFIVTWRREKRVIKALDTLNLWPVKLDKIGDVVGLPKLTMPDHKNPGPEWDAYCKRDVEVIYRMCLKWWAWLMENDLGSAGVTLAGQALNTYRHRFMSTRIFIDGNQNATDLSRASYLGGRTECFRLGKLPAPVHLLDVNSMYPAVMESELYPCKLKLHATQVTPRDLVQWLEKYCVVASVELNTDEPCYPVRVPGYLMNPTGKFTAVLTTPELRHALDRGRVVKVNNAAIYDRAPLFKEYVTEMYSRRMEYKRAGDKLRDFLCKRLLNSLYGKFGQLGWVTDIKQDVPWEGVGCWTEIDADDGKVYRCRALGGVLIVEHQEGEATFSVPAIASHVTAYGRVILWGLICAAGRENVYYCDTDSLLVNNEGLERMASQLDPVKLGALAWERSYTWWTNHGLKDYENNRERKVKGISKKAVWLDANTVEQDIWLGVKGLLIRNHTHAPLIMKQVKHLKREYRKGEVSKEGSIRPWVLPGEWGRWSDRKLSDVTK